MTSLKNRSVVPFFAENRDIEMTDGKIIDPRRGEYSPGLVKYFSGEKIDVTIRYRLE